MPRKVSIRVTLDDEECTIPYDGEEHDQGTIYPFRSLVRHPEQIDLIPELEGQPALKQLLRVLNGPGGTFESVRIDTSYHEVEDQCVHVVVVGFIFRDRRLFGSYDNCLLFAGKLLETLHADPAFHNDVDSAQLEMQRATLTEHDKQGWIMDLFLMGQGEDRRACDANLAKRCHALHQLLSYGP